MRTFLCSIALILLVCGCSAIPKAQKGGRVRAEATATNLTAEAVQPENPAAPASQSQEWVEETSFVIPAGSMVSGEGQVAGGESIIRGEGRGASGELLNAKVAKETEGSGGGVSFLISEAMPVKRTVQKRSSATVGASQKDEGRALGVRFAAMKPVQWTGIALCAASIAGFYFGWPTIGFLCLAVGGGMIVTAAVLPGHELLILGVGSIGVVVAMGLVVYAYRTGHLHAVVKEGS